MEKADTLQKSWVKIYPSYIDKGIKHSEGRKVSSEIAVENPTINEIFLLCANVLKLECRQEVVSYSI